MNIQEILKHYLICAIWSTNQEDGSPFDNDFEISDFSETAKKQALLDIESFVKKAGSLLNGITDEQIGHDIWLTRNRHGAGFWDRDFINKEIGEKLTDIAHELGETSITISDSNELEFD